MKESEIMSNEHLALQSTRKDAGTLLDRAKVVAANTEEICNEIVGRDPTVADEKKLSVISEGVVAIVSATHIEISVCLDRIEAALRRL